MTEMPTDFKPVDSGLRALAMAAGYYRIPVDCDWLARDLVLAGRPADTEDLLRAAHRVGLKARVIKRLTPSRLARIPTPAIVRRKNGSFVIFAGQVAEGRYRLVDPVLRDDSVLGLDEAMDGIEPMAILVARRFAGEGYNPATFGFRWFLPSLWRYRQALGSVLLASLFLQIFALVTPLFFQVIIDKVLTHKAYSTLFVLVAGLVLIGMFDVVLQYLRTYALSHSANRIDVELGRRLFRHMMLLPLAYFETRPAGQTLARMRELENIRSFLTGQALFSGLDLVFALVFVAVLFSYSVPLTLIVLATIPVYILIGLAIRPALLGLIKEKFNRGAISQQFLVESIVGIPTIKGSAVEPMMQAQWEERLAAYVKTSFDATMLATGGQNAIQYASRLTTALTLLFGAQAVMNNQLSVGALVAFNMIAAQTIQPILRLSQLWQDFQQVQVSVERLGDILNYPTEATTPSTFLPPRPRGRIEIKRVNFRYQQGTPDVLRDVSLDIAPGEVIGIVGPSGSGKSTLTKLMQRLYRPNEGAILLDGNDLGNVDPSWLRSNIGVVMQENILFNRSVHDNIAFANPAMSRAQVIDVARMTGAHAFISKMSQGYDTIIEERGSNLSGGQRQRIAIARALATNPPILIFDEATSALDYESERVIQANMAHIVKGRTVIIIAHRLATVRHCNRIIGLAEGRVVESGTHAELLARKGGLYAYLWALQGSHLDGAQIDSAQIDEFAS